MRILDIRVLGDPVLRKATVPVEKVTEEIRSLISDMFDTMYAAEGIGLAAPQVGRTERIAVMDVEGQKFAFINPEIIEREGSIRGEEGCLSIPDVFGDVTRASRVIVRALNEEGAEIEAEGTELLARCMQHEIDHLDGILFLDHLSLIRRQMLLAKWRREHKDDTGFTKEVQPAASRTE